MVEVLEYRFEVRGVPAGKNVVRRTTRDGEVLEESEATFTGPLSDASVVQLSRRDAEAGHSLEFRESTKDRGGERRMQITFDSSDGVVRMQRGNDVAEVPYVEPFRDPLSMLSEIRSLDPDASRIRIPMLGKTVEAHALGETELQTPLGPKRARAFQVFPGGSWLWVDVEAPHEIVKLTQRTGDAFVDAWLVERSEGSRMPAWDGESEGGSGKRKRGRRRRRRGGRSRSKSKKNA